jgi:hypothetical protein
VGTEARCIARVNEIDCAAKDRVLNAFVMGKVESIGGDWFLNASFEARPAQKPAFAGNGELCVAELECGSKDDLIRRARKAGMEFADELRRRKTAGGMGLDQVFSLVLELVKIGIGREDSNRHDELPFVCPRSAY